MKTQTILTPAGDRLVVLAEADYAALLEAAEDASDGRAVDAFRYKLARGEEELIPSDVVDRVEEGENRIKVWREYRGLTSDALANRAGIAQSFLSQIETWQRHGTIETLRKISAALDLTIDDIVEPSSDVGEKKNVKIIRLIKSEGGLTRAELARKTGASSQHVKGVCDNLVATKQAEQRDGGRYYWIANQSL